MAWLQQQQQQQPLQEDGFSSVLHETRLVRAESMDIKNDPRFFTGNVLDKRLAAFGCLSVVSGLMVQNAMKAAFIMKKDMNVRTLDGACQLAGFLMICMVLYGNVLAAYVGVVQPYHIYRLMTAGPTGFETACAYYLNKEIIDLRHFSIKMALLSMPLYIIASGFRFVVKFERDWMKPDKLSDTPPLWARLEGLLACGIFVLVGFGLFTIHWRHGEIFRNLYDTIGNNPEVQGIMTRLDAMMSSGSRATSQLDV
uniref:Uncharacterized protein n=1 Tax=Alexandrium monilatum TaxID=311494 RepID=A0A7S4RXS6_9DINO|mmetsp:Transcript_55868/g.166177  ORF Transcript_55868/g.166177 Transcript_55868/m.166177 type:complete len:254 (+) Transcript_55868:105-866(+)